MQIKTHLLNKMTYQQIFSIVPQLTHASTPNENENAGSSSFAPYGLHGYRDSSTGSGTRLDLLV